VGRACVHPSYRNGGVIALLWAGLASYLKAGGYDYAFGCASIPIAGDGDVAASICARLLRDHLSPLEWRVFPRRPFPLAFDPDFDVALPPLVKGYLRLGAYVCGDPAWDPSFQTADVIVLLPVARLNPRYVRRWLRPALPAAA
jgi:putative hemolysin